MMKKFLTLIVSAALLSGPLTGNLAFAQQLLLVQDACQVVGQQLANDRGATLLAASATTANGAAACEVILLVPASDGSRPKREVVIVPR